MTSERPRPPRPRRGAPIFSRFIVTGVLLGFALAALTALTEPGSATYSQTRAVMYFGVLGALVGGLLGALVALALDRRR